ncbi:MAG TPA: fasciclin domain-containing protein [Phycisphaerales bacterium]|nr:fasciclin domain-containing protein [Phycisphaerales bacterium]HMP35967.1 fasciclin domain-containing protein [Phycisphaerales bacterium]
MFLTTTLLAGGLLVVCPPSCDRSAPDAPVVSLAAVADSCGKVCPVTGALVSAGAVKELDIVDTAVAAGEFRMLAAALAAAGLVETLKGEGPFTVFAPTDAAFAKLPKETIETLLAPEGKERLTAILTYHVVPGKVTAEKVVKLPAAETVNGQRVDIKVKDGVVMIDGAKVTTADIMASNGVIHVIDAVILPTDQGVVEVAKERGFSTLAAAIEAAGLVETLSGKGPFTVFAPTDAAFAKLPAGTVERLLKPENKADLTKVLKAHVVPGRVYSDKAVTLSTAKTAGGWMLPIAARDGKVLVGGATVTAVDVDARNGVIHVIDSVIIPE